MSHNTLNSNLPSTLEELLKKLQEQGIEEFATKMVKEYIERSK